MDWKTKLMIGIGIAILTVPSVLLLTMADSAFRQECKAKCVSQGLTYRVVTTGAAAVNRVEYPATCHCVANADRTVWERLRDDFF